MPEANHDIDRLVDHSELWSAVGDMLRLHVAQSGKIARLKSSACVDRTSFQLVDLDVELEDGTVMRLVLKDLGMANLHETARRVKPGFLYNPLREIRTYQEILTPCCLDTAHFYGAVVNPEQDRHWLVLEKISGARICHVSDDSAWLEAARWLARLHARFAGAGDHLARCAPLLRYDAAYYRTWLERFMTFPSLSPRPAGWEFVAETYDRAIERLIQRPATLVHGEFYASNVLVEEALEGCRIRPVDWEMAAIGPGLVDLAALTSGAWTAREQTEMARAYHDTMVAQGMAGASFDELLVALDDCRLHLAIRWLGWAPDWSPPRENTHDWLGETIALSDKMRTR